MKKVISFITTLVAVAIVVYGIACYCEVLVKTGNAINESPVYSEYNFLVNMTKN